MTIKFYMSKTYDRVEWAFLHKMMVQMGFSSGMINLVMSYIKKISYSVIINENSSERFYPSKGLR